MIQIAALLARPFLGKLPIPDTAKSKVPSLGTLLNGGSGESWVPLARQQTTLPFSELTRASSVSSEHREVGQDGQPVRWFQFDWPRDQKVDDCTLHRVRWRFYQNGLISLEVIASKDVSDLVGHAIELRDKRAFSSACGRRRSWYARAPTIKYSSRRSATTICRYGCISTTSVPIRVGWASAYDEGTQ